MGENKSTYGVLDNYNSSLAEWVKKVTSSPFEVEVDYPRKLTGMVEAGKYDSVDDFIKEKNFLIKGEGKRKVKIILFHFGYWISAEQVIIQMKKKGCRPASIEELLALGETQPDLQREAEIIALGCSGWWSRGPNRAVVRLSTAGSFGYGRGVYVDWLEAFDWCDKNLDGGNYCHLFAAVRK